MTFQGVYPVLITPMNKDGSIDWVGLKVNIQYFVDQGVAGLVVNGSTGEFVSLTKEERFRIGEVAVEVVNGRVPLLIGTAAETTADAIMYTKQAEVIGADGALIINSYYAHPKEHEIYEHFRAISESVSFPIMMYNNPFTSGVNMSTELILKLGKEIENITHIKESSGDIRKVREIVQEGNPDLQLFCGADDLALESFFVGATGWISVAANIAPKLTKELFTCVQEKQWEKAKELNKQLLPLCQFLEDSGKYIQIVKKAMERFGLAGGPPRKPRLPITEEEEKYLDSVLKSLSSEISS